MDDTETIFKIYTRFTFGRDIPNRVDKQNLMKVGNQR